MRKSRFGEEQIIAILREQETGSRTEESAGGMASAAPLLQAEGALWRVGGARGMLVEAAWAAERR
jgi:hypothetical protein